MNIIIINGSPRKNGATAAILHRMEENLQQKEDVFVEFVDISNLEMNPCRGCCLCYKTGHCYMQDDAEILSDKIAAADGLIIGSPTYASNVSGQLKQLIDRGHFVMEQLLFHKYVVSVVTGENYGSKETNRILTKLLIYSGANVSGRIVYDLPFNHNPCSNHKMTRKIGCLTDKLYRDMKHRKMYLFQYMVHKVIFAMGIKPFVIKKGEHYKGVLYRWEKSGVI